MPGADPGDLVSESATAMRAMTRDPATLVLIARRLIDHHPTCGPLWTMCARAVMSGDPAASLADSARAATHDAVGERVDDEIRKRDGIRPAVLTALACAPSTGGTGRWVAMVEPSGTRRATRARVEQREVWLAVPVGACVTRAMWDDMVRRVPDTEVLGSGDVDLVVRATTSAPAATWMAEPECPPWPGLLAGDAR